VNGLSYSFIAKIFPKLTTSSKESSLLVLGSKTMKTFLRRTPKFGLFFVVAFLALQASPAAAADSGSSTYVSTINKKSISTTFKDIYAFRYIDSGKEVTMVILTNSPMDKKAMTAALRKKPNLSTINTFGNYLDDMEKATLKIDQNAVTSLHFYSPPNYNRNVIGKSAVTVNTTKRVEGSFSWSDDETSKGGEAHKFDLRFATDLADVGRPVEW
jgi:hypothetical protein